MSYIKNTAGQFLGFLLVNCCGAPVTGAEVTAVRSIDGDSQTAVTGTVTELGGGQYNLEMSQADTNGDDITFLFTASNAVPVEKTITTTDSAAGGAAGLFPSVVFPNTDYRAGNFYLPTLPGLSALTSTGVSTGKQYFLPFLCTFTHTFLGLAFTNGGSANGNKFRTGIYSSSARAPSALILDAGEITVSDSSTDTMRTTTISQQLVAGTTYWLSILLNANQNMTVVSTFADATLPMELGHNTGFKVAASLPIVGYSATQAYGALPANAGTLTTELASGFPLLQLKA